ncbi:DUF1007 family protein [Ancylobacter terrae]|uniref:DUF1007 family protein n=1 Tax=Ancylobacter sp. sgz301288 TaxID=3342077 RepID=UPI00385D1851
MIRRALLAVLALIGFTGVALAHPHVWVTIRSEMLYAPDGTLTGVRHHWTFDEAFSAFALQGLDADKDGKPTEATLKSLAQVNVDSLKEFDYFTIAERGKEKFAFKPPVDYQLTYDGTELTLHFTLPLDKPLPAKGNALALDVYDPTYFVAFTLADDNPVKLAGAPAGCALDLHRPDPAASASTSLSESFFNALTSSSQFGSQFANRVTVKCP